MAGSYYHAVSRKSGKLRNPEKMRGMVENGGDAYETIEEMYGMIWWLANEIVDHDEADVTSPQTDEQAAYDRAMWVEEARQAYQRGIALSPGVQK